MSQKRLRITLLLLVIFVINFPGTKGKRKDSKRSHMVFKRQVVPTNFNLAATRFIVMLPFLPLLMAIPSASAVALPLVLALQDRLRTIFPNMPTLLPRPSNQNPANSTADSESTVASPETSRYRRSLTPPKVVTDRFRDVMDLLSKTDDVFYQLTSSEPDCRRQALCRLQYAFSPTVGSFLGNMLQVFKLETQLERLDLANTTKTMIKDTIKATSSGLFRQDCAAIYSRCAIKINF